MTEPTGVKIKQLREAANLSIEELAKAAGIAPSQVELIENGKVIPTLSCLIKMCRSMGVRLGTVLDGAEHPGPALSKCQERKERTVSLSCDSAGDRSNLNFYALAAGKSDRNMEPYIIDVEWIPEKEEKKSQHEGEEFIYVMKGQIELQYGNDSFTLGEGDSIYYDSIVPHCLSTTGPDQKAKVLAVTYIPY